MYIRYSSNSDFFSGKRLKAYLPTGKGRAEDRSSEHIQAVFCIQNPIPA
jgi:hypothetical protein